MISCKACKAVIHDEIERPVEAKDYKPCPNCGSEERVFDEFPVFTMAPLELYIQGVHERCGQQIGYSESEIEGRSSSADVMPDGSIHAMIKGSSPQGEESTNKVCDILRRKLNSIGSNNWDKLVTDQKSAKSLGIILSEPADGIVFNSLNRKLVLKIQVVRAIIDGKFWNELNSKKFKLENFNITQFIEHLKDSIKLKEKKILPHDRIDLVLALDATMLPGLTFNEAVNLFRSTHMQWAASLGFQSIWLVGPTIELTHRLDIIANR